MKHSVPIRLTLLLISQALCAGGEVAKQAPAADWPQFMGPARTGAGEDSPKLLSTWPKEGPRLVWKSGPLPAAPAAGVGSPVVSGGKVYSYAHVPVPMDGIKPFNAEFLASWGWADGMSDELSKSVDAAARAKERLELKDDAALNAYTDKYIATLPPEQAKQYDAVIRTRIKIGKNAFLTDSLHWMAAMKDREVKTRKEFMNLFVDRFVNGIYHSDQALYLGHYVDKVYKDQQWSDTLICLDAATGQELWRASLPGARKEYGVEYGCSGTPAVAGNRVFFRGSGGLYCVDASQKGAQLWAVKGIPGNNSPTLKDDVVYCYVGDLAAFDAKSGRELWRQPKIKHEHQTPALWTHDGTTYVLAGSDTKMFCVKAASGEICWSVPAPGGGEGSSPVVSGDIVVTRGGACTAFSLAPDKGEQLWTATGVADHGGASPVIYNGYVYLAGQCYNIINLLNVYDLKTGALKYNQKGAGYGTTPAVAGGVVFACCDSEYKICRLFAYKANPDKYEPLGSMREPVLASCSSPAVAGGLLYVRLPEAIACYNVAEK